MRIATWNVNSLKARLEKLAWWVERARRDVLLLQETKCTDEEAQREELGKLGYELAHHGSGGRNGVAIASRVPPSDIETNFGEPLEYATIPGGRDDEPLTEARIIAGVVANIRVASVYAPNGRTVG